jgi:hypothetical protein
MEMMKSSYYSPARMLPTSSSAADDEAGEEMRCRQGESRLRRCLSSGLLSALPAVSEGDILDTATPSTVATVDGDAASCRPTLPLSRLGEGTSC